MASIPKEQLYFVEIARKRGIVDDKTADLALAKAEAEGTSVQRLLNLSLGAQAAVEEKLAALAFKCVQCGKRDHRSPSEPSTADLCEECVGFASSSPAAEEQAPAWQTKSRKRPDAVKPDAAKPAAPEPPPWQTKRYSEAVRKITGKIPVPALPDEPKKAEPSPEPKARPAPEPKAKPAPEPARFAEPKTESEPAREADRAEGPATIAEPRSEDGPTHPSDGDAASAPATEMAPERAPGPAAPPREASGLAAGQVIGGCRIATKLGQGGMGRVYRARHLGFDRDVALKVLEERLVARSGFIEQFTAEARTLFGLDHPNIVRVLDVGKDDSGLHYLIMELLEGGSVHGLWEKYKKKVPIVEAVRIASEAAQGLFHAHQKKLLHRDVKPANLMLNAEGRVKVVDFGLAVPTENELFIATAIAGTPHYMAPEQADGLKLDARCDQYALGVTLFQLVCGRLPFEGKKPVEILFAHVSEAPPKPRDLRDDCPEWLERVILKMLAKAPADRFVTLGDVAMALGQAETSTLARGPELAASTLAPPPRIRVEEIIALEKGLQPRPIALPSWRPAIAVAAASVVAAGLFLAFPAREALARSPDASRDEAPQAVRELARAIEKDAVAGSGETLVAALTRATDAAHDLGPRPGASRFAALVELLQKRKKEKTDRTMAALSKSTDELVARKRWGAAIEALDPASRELEALGLVAFANEQRAKVAAALLAERGEVYIPRGPYVAASGEAVTLPGYYIDRTEVTNEAWASAVEKSGLPPLPGWTGGRLDPALAKRPATGVSFEEAVRFAGSLGKRIPTSQEWEKAARGPADDRAYPWGPRFEPGKANVLDGGAGALEDVGTHESDASPYGVRDLAGNALEWVVGEKSPLAAGGGFLSHAASARVTARIALEPGTRHPALGFRCARDVEKD